MIASQKQKISSKTGDSTIGAKRKRDVEVIVIDDNDVEEEVSQQNGSSTGKENGYLRSSDANSQLQQNVSGNTNHQASTNEQSLSVPIPYPQESAKTRTKPLASLSQQTGSAYRTFSTSSGANTVNIGTGIRSLQWELGASSQMRNSDTTASATSVTGNGMMQVTQSSMPTVVNTTSGSWSTRSAASTNFVNASHPNDQLPLGDAISSENTLSDTLVDHYHEANQNVANMELQCEQLNKQIATTTGQGFD